MFPKPVKYVCVLNSSMCSNIDVKNMRKKDDTSIYVWMRKLKHLSVCVNANRDINEKQERFRERKRGIENEHINNMG